ncbi:MAG: hypothetical protein AAF604_23965 [Acidobacteriota bacterium]
MTGEKDESLRELVSRLGLPARGWIVVDHWVDDVCALGIARRDAPRVLVYVSSGATPAGRFDYQCEVPNGPEPEDFQTVASGEEVAFEELLEALEKHLG